MKPFAVLTRLLRRVLVLALAMLLGLCALLLPRASVARADTWVYVNSWNSAYRSVQQNFFVQPVGYAIPAFFQARFEAWHTMVFYKDLTNGLYLNVYATDYTGYDCMYCNPGGGQAWSVRGFARDQHYNWTGNSWVLAVDEYPGQTAATCPATDNCAAFQASNNDGYWNTYNNLHYGIIESGACCSFQMDHWTVEWLSSYQHVDN